MFSIKFMKSIFIQEGRTVRRLIFSDITHLDLSGKYVYVHTKKDSFRISREGKSPQLYEWSSKLVRVSKSTKINVDHIDIIEGNNVKVAGNWFSIGKVYKKEFLSKLLILGS